MQFKVKPTVSYIIPTMMRQDFTLNLLNEEPILSANASNCCRRNTNQLNFSLYNPDNYPLMYSHQITQGSCRARNEAIALCKRDYIVFGTMIFVFRQIL
jgi:hypothetical protein